MIIKNKFFGIIPVAFIFFTACTLQTEPIIQTIIVEVTSAPEPTEEPTEELIPEITDTSSPSPTPTKKPTSTPIPEIEDVREEIIGGIVNVLNTLDDVEQVNMVRIEPGVINIEVKNKWASADMQPNLSYLIIQSLALAFGEAPPVNLYSIVGARSFAIHLTSYSTTNDFKYESFTDLDTLQKVYRREISYEEWVEAAQAGFR